MEKFQFQPEEQSQEMPSLYASIESEEEYQEDSQVVTISHIKKEEEETEKNPRFLSEKR